MWAPSLSVLGKRIGLKESVDDRLPISTSEPLAGLHSILDGRVGRHQADDRHDLLYRLSIMVGNKVLSFDRNTRSHGLRDELLDGHSVIPIVWAAVKYPIRRQLPSPEAHWHPFDAAECRYHFVHQPGQLSAL